MLSQSQLDLRGGGQRHERSQGRSLGVLKAAQERGLDFRVVPGPPLARVCGRVELGGPEHWDLSRSQDPWETGCPQPLVFFSFLWLFKPLRLPLGGTNYLKEMRNDQCHPCHPKGQEKTHSVWSQVRSGGMAWPCPAFTERPWASHVTSLSCFLLCEMGAEVFPRSQTF